jgi:protoporphyrinogen oxidase
MLQEVLGYIDGGTDTLIRALVAAIQKLDGEVRLGARVDEVVTAGNRVAGVRTGGTVEPFDAVISTIPTPLVPGMIPGLSERARREYASIDNIGVACLVFKLRRSLTPHFWVNITDERMAIPGFVEFSRLRPTPDTIVFVPFYMPTTHPRWARSDQELLGEAFGYLKLINPALTDADLLDSKLGRLKFAQPICPPGFAARVPSVQTEIEGLQVADTCFYYPEDRGISESVRYGRLMAKALDDPTVWRR